MTSLQALDWIWCRVGLTRLATVFSTKSILSSEDLPAARPPSGPSSRFRGSGAEGVILAMADFTGGFGRTYALRCSSARPAAAGSSATRPLSPPRGMRAVRGPPVQAVGRCAADIANPRAESYGRDVYEAIVPFILERVRPGAKDVDHAADALRAVPVPDQRRLARIEEERDRAFAELSAGPRPARPRHGGGRDPRRSRTTRAHSRRGSSVLGESARLVGRRRPDEQRALATTLFARIRVLGIQ